MPIGGDVDRIDRRFRIIDGQAVGAAVHDAQRCVWTGAKGARLSGQPFGRRCEKAQAQEATLQFTLGEKLIHRVIERVVHAAQSGQLHIDRLSPVAQAAAGLKAITPTQILILATVEVQLIAHDQPGAAAFRQCVVTLRLVVSLGIFREDGHQRVFKAVVHCQQLLWALGLAATQYDTLFQIVRPSVAFTGLDRAVADIREVNKGDSIVAG
ncbi:hypothetical protein D3C76_1011160 [compost metagenome]